MFSLKTLLQPRDAEQHGMNKPALRVGTRPEGRLIRDK